VHFGGRFGGTFNFFLVKALTSFEVQQTEVNPGINGLFTSISSGLGLHNPLPFQFRHRHRRQEAVQS
jgi:hypothetical protein